MNNPPISPLARARECPAATFMPAAALGHTDIGMLLEYEVDRARRYRRPLSLLRAVPQARRSTLSGPSEAEGVAGVIRSNLRRIDHVGVLNDQSILAILPETEQREAGIAAWRLVSALSRPGGAFRSTDWLIGVAPLGDGYQSIETMLLSALGEALEAERRVA